MSSPKTNTKVDARAAIFFFPFFFFFFWNSSHNILHWCDSWLWKRKKAQESTEKISPMDLGLGKSATECPRPIHTGQLENSSRIEWTNSHALQFVWIDLYESRTGGLILTDPHHQSAIRSLYALKQIPVQLIWSRTIEIEAKCEPKHIPGRARVKFANLVPRKFWRTFSLEFSQAEPGFW